MENANQTDILKEEVPASAVSTADDIKPGEWPFLILLAFMTVALLFDSFKLIGIVDGKLSSPSSVPQVVLFAMLALIAVVAGTLIKNRKAAPQTVRRSLPQHVNLICDYLICKEVIILLIGVFAYAFLLPYLHFEITSLIFLAAMMYLLERKNPVKKIFISVGTLVVLLLIFKYFMRVVLP